VKYSDPEGPKGGAWAPYTEKTPKFMVFKLNEQDEEASFFGDPEIAPQPQGFPFGAPARPAATGK